MSNLKEWLEKNSINIGNYEKVEADSEKGKQIINENNLTFLPSLLISRDIEEYWWIFQSIENLFVLKDYYTLKNPAAPYKDIATEKIKGKVTITYITNKSCEDCYNVTSLKKLFTNGGIYIDKEKYVDVNTKEGKDLLTEYDIKDIPTVILSKEISDYNIRSVLEERGKFVNDEFVLEDLDSLNVKYQKTNT